MSEEDKSAEESSVGGDEDGLATDNAFVTVAEFYDASRAQLFVTALTDAGIVCSAPGLLHRAMIPGGYIRVPVQVPRESAAKAAEIMEMIGVGADPPKPLVIPQFAVSLEPLQRAIEAADPTAIPTDRLRRVAVLACFIWPGGGHHYARESGRAWLLFLGAIITLVLAFAESPLFFEAAFSVFFADAIGSVAFVRAAQLKRAPSWIARFAPALVVLGLLKPLVLYTWMPEWILPREVSRICTVVARCDFESRAVCIRRNADRVYSERTLQPDQAECALCLEDGVCSNVGGTCDMCGPFVTLPSAGHD